MRINDFKLERFFAAHEFNVRYLLSASDCEALAFGADASKYDDCMKDSRTEARVQQDFQEGSKLGVRGTPAFFLTKVDAQGKVITTKNVSGALPFDQFDQTLKALLNP